MSAHKNGHQHPSGEKIIQKSPPALMRRIKELDGLRALAILLVIACHYTGVVAATHGLSEFGWIGVDIFFVLSGYLITTILLGLRTKPSPYKTFYARRAVRIFPPYYLVTFLILLAALLSHHLNLLPHRFVLRQIFFLQAYTHADGVHLLDICSHPRWYLTHLPSMGLYAHHLPIGWRGLWPSIGSSAGPFWSLSIEEYFYLLWAPVVLRCPRRWILAIGMLVCIVETLLRWMTPDWLSYFNIFYRFDTLLFGAFLALLIENWNRTSIPQRAAVVFRSVIVACVLIIAGILFAIRPVLSMEVRYSPLVLVIGVPAFSLATACVIGLLILRSGTNWWLARLLRTGALQYLGTISYTMYLIHLFAGWMILQVAKAVHPLRSSVLLQNVLAFILTIILARASWHFLEKPLLRWKDQRFPRSPHPPEPLLN